MSSRNGRGAASWAGGAGRLGGCPWLLMAGLAFLFVAGAAGAGIDATPVLVPLLLAPLALGLVVFVAGHRVVVQRLSAAAGIAYAVLGLWNDVRAGDVERMNPGSVEVSGGGTSATIVLLGLAIAAWSLGGAGLLLRTGRR